MSSATEIWLYYEPFFLQEINRAASQRDIERYYYTFLEFLSTQKYTLQVIEAMKPLIHGTMMGVIKKRFQKAKTATVISQNPSETSFPLVMGQPEDVVTLETNIKTYNKMIKWMAKENDTLSLRASKNVVNDNTHKDVDKMWIRAVK